MDNGYRTRLEQYLSSMLKAREMLEQGIISEADFVTIDTTIAAKYGFKSCNIYRGVDLLYKEARGNMSHNKEVTSCQE